MLYLISRLITKTEQVQTAKKLAYMKQASVLRIHIKCLCRADSNEIYFYFINYHLYAVTSSHNSLTFRKQNSHFLFFHFAWVLLPFNQSGGWVNQKTLDKPSDKWPAEKLGLLHLWSNQVRQPSWVRIYATKPFL